MAEKSKEAEENGVQIKIAPAEKIQKRQDLRK